MRRTLLSIAAAAAALTACNGSPAHGAKSASAADSVAHVGAPAPNWTEPTVPGGSIELASLHGNVVYLNFFATWCPPCNEEAPAINKLEQAFRARGLRVVGIDVLENAKKAEQFRSEHHLTYPAVVDDGTLRDQYNVNGLPVHAFIDRNGVLRSLVVGQMAPAEIRNNIVKLLR